jgi:hypothetical protein
MILPVGCFTIPVADPGLSTPAHRAGDIVVTAIV